MQSVSFLAVAALGVMSCQTPPAAPGQAGAEPQGATICRQEIDCVVSGNLEMSSDGHAFIGILHLDGGGCLNVSLPDKQSRKLLGKAAARKTLTGSLYGYPDESIDEFRINKRNIGFGLCGNKILYVK